MAEHAIDNREIVGSSPTPWTIFERASPSGKAPGFQPGTAWVRIPPPAPFFRLPDCWLRSRFGPDDLATLTPANPHVIAVKRGAELAFSLKIDNAYLPGGRERLITLVQISGVDESSGSILECSCTSMDVTKHVYSGLLLLDCLQ
jgi:hypothetical protein